MRAALWLLALFGVAVAAALFAGNNQGTITLYWPPYRIDLSLNMVVLLLVTSFVHGVRRAACAGGPAGVPHQARRWRVQQKERAMHSAMLDALTHMLAGRFIRSRKAALAALSKKKHCSPLPTKKCPMAPPARAGAHGGGREFPCAARPRHARKPPAAGPGPGPGQVAPPTSRNCVKACRCVVRAGRWTTETPARPSNDLPRLPHGAARRTLALRIKLKATRLARQTQEALDTARLLGKHRAFSADAAQSIVRGLAIELINSRARPVPVAADLACNWSSSERNMPELAIQAAQRLVNLGGEPAQARAWLLPVWERMVQLPNALPDHHALKLVRALESGLDTLDAAWLARIESAQLANPAMPGCNIWPAWHASNASCGARRSNC
jgi:HemY protein